MVKVGTTCADAPGGNAGEINTHYTQSTWCDLCREPTGWPHWFAWDAREAGRKNHKVALYYGLVIGPRSAFNGRRCRAPAKAIRAGYRGSADCGGGEDDGHRQDVHDSTDDCESEGLSKWR